MMAPQTLAVCLAAIKTNPARFYVYVLSRPDGLPFYVGKGQTDRIAAHEAEARQGLPGAKCSIIRRIRYSGAEVLYRVEGYYLLEADAFEAEKRVIASIGRQPAGPLVNRTDGGDGPAGLIQIISAETRAKISAALKGRKKTPEHVAKVVANRMGYRHSDEVRAKMSAAVRRPESLARVGAARRGAKLTKETIGKIKLAKLGLRHSQATKLKMSAAHRGKIMSQASKEKMRLNALARPPMSEETKQKIRLARAKQAPMSAEARAKCAEAARQMQARKRAAQTQT